MPSIQSNMTINITEEDATILRNAVTLHANYMETGNIVLSAMDAAERGMKLKPITIEQQERVKKMRELAARLEGFL